MRSGFIPIIVALVIAAALIGVYILYSQQTPPTPPPNTNSYTCPHVEWINCMPMVAPEGQLPQNPQCAPEYLKWAKDNCPNFQGAAY